MVVGAAEAVTVAVPVAISGSGVCHACGYALDTLSSLS